MRFAALGVALARLVTALCCFVVLLGASVGAAGVPALEVRLEPQRLGLDDTARLTITVLEADRETSPTIGEIDNFEVVAGPAIGRQLSWVNGVATSAMTFTYLLRPLAVGSARVDNIEVTVGSVTLKSGPMQAEVVAGGIDGTRPGLARPVSGFEPLDGARGRRPQRQVVLRQLIDNSQPFLGEPVVASVVLDTNTAGVESFELLIPPSFPGWWAQPVEFTTPPTPQLVEVDGVRFQRFVIASHAIVPLKTGDLVLPAVVARVGIRGRSVFSGGQRLERRSDEVAVRVLERPHAPDGFTGAVGRFSYKATLEPRSVRLGESAVLTIELTGDGNLPLVDSPAVWPTCGACELYPPEEQLNITVDEEGIHGTRIWRASLVPRGSGKLRLEPVILAFFDPEERTYRRQTLGAMSLDVGAPQQAPDSGPEPGTPKVPGDGTGRAAGMDALPIWGWAVLAVAVGAIGGGIGSWLVLRRRSSLVPRRRPDQRPDDRARELQGALESWWVEIRDCDDGDLEAQVATLRKKLEVVRFAPGRADHSGTVSDLEAEVYRLMR